jgi:hypothetical protein
VKRFALKTLFVPVLVAGTATACTHTAAGPYPVANDVADDTVGRVEISTIPFGQGQLRSATYTPSGKILVSYADKGADKRHVSLAIMNDDGSDLRPIFSQAVPAREKDNGIRFMVFPDNQRIFLGDFVIECAPSLDDCDNAELLLVEYPAQVAGGDHVAHRWSEMIIAPDNRHIAWTTLLSNYAALVFTGELRKEAGGYVVADPQIVSTVEPFEPDPKHPDGVIPRTIRGGEVKQFIHGGTALSMVGAIERDLPDSVVQHLATGEMEAITETPGYTETTIFSPDERLGITMTTRFSEKTDPAVLGLVPRPYPAALNMGLNMFAYTYAVTGVRTERPGNVGPALINIDASRTQDGYMGTNLNTEEEWVFHSPMSWHPGGKKALWIEGRRTDGQRRIQSVHLPDYQPAATVTAKPLPRTIPYASSDLSVIPALVQKTRDIDVKVYGRASGHIEYRRDAGTIEKTYVNFSEDGENLYSGRETMQVNPKGQSTYRAEVRLSGRKPGVMDLKITFGPLGGDLPASIIFAPDASGTPLTHGYAEYDGRRIAVDTLVP